MGLDKKIISDVQHHTRNQATMSRVHLRGVSRLHVYVKGFVVKTAVLANTYIVT